MLGLLTTNLTLLIIGTIHKGLDVSPCLKGWKHSHGCCYKLFRKELTWQEAELKCNDYGKTGHLVTIRDKKEAAVVRGLVKSQKYYNYVWIGMFGAGSTEGWWIDDTELDYTAWAPGQPRYSDDRHFYCVQLAPNKGQWTWETADCDTPQAYICKYQP